MLHSLSDKKRRFFYEQSLGSTATVLFERTMWKMAGCTASMENYVRVRAKYDPLMVNTLKRVQLVSIAENGTVEIEEPELELASHYDNRQSV